MSHQELQSPRDYMMRYPRLTAHVIADSFGYFTPTNAAMLLMDVKRGNENRSEWVRVVYGCNSQRALRAAVKIRHHYNGQSSEYKLARFLVYRALTTAEEPMFRGWPASYFLYTSRPMQIKS